MKVKKIVRKNDFDEAWQRLCPSIAVKEAGLYQFSKLIIDDNVTLISLYESETKKTIDISFNGHVSSMRFSDEGMRLKLYEFLDSKYGADFYQSWSFFKVENSSYLKWLSSQSNEVSDFYEVHHFVFMCSNEIVEIAASFYPEIEYK